MVRPSFYKMVGRKKKSESADDHCRALVNTENTLLQSLQKAIYLDSGRTRTIVDLQGGYDNEGRIVLCDVEYTDTMWHLLHYSNEKLLQFYTGASGSRGGSSDKNDDDDLSAIFKKLNQEDDHVRKPDKPRDDIKKKELPDNVEEIIRQRLFRDFGKRHPHTLTAIQSYGDSRRCDLCGYSTPGTYYNCATCNYDECRSCYPNNSKHVVKQDPAPQLGLGDGRNNRHRHTLTPIQDYRGCRRCDICSSSTPGIFYNCALCNYDECPRCYSGCRDQGMNGGFNGTPLGRALGIPVYRQPMQMQYPIYPQFYQG